MSGAIDESAARRSFLWKTGLLITNAALIYPITRLAQAQSREDEKKAEDVFPPEDLMREHGVLRRILLMYENLRDRLSREEKFPVEALSGAAHIIQSFIENYHEKLEEDHLFPRFEKARKLVDLVEVLRAQHEAGRLITALILKFSGADSLKEAAKRKEIAEALHRFIVMYRPHAAREDTVLFPALRSVVSEREFDLMGEAFEDKEQELFGKNGFEKIVTQVADLEKLLGIYDLAQFTPPK
ncbi:MAG: hemerythrin domain-containing protein [Desulfomonile tiedjei]|nr:hemerythrin domain-containing protein [Desulfomonile tiedjei]